LKISIINPKKEFHVTQGFSRKRAEKLVHDFNIFFDETNLMFLASYLPEDKQKRFLDLLEKKDAVQKAFETPELADFNSYSKGIEYGIRELVVDALIASQKSANYDSEMVVNQDILFTKHIGTMIKEVKRKICNREIINNDRTKEEIETLVQASFPKLKGKLLKNLVSWFQNDLSDYLANIELSLYEEFINDYDNFSVKYPTIEKQGRESYLRDLWENKLKNKKKMWRHKLKDKSYLTENTTAFVGDKLDSISPVIARIEKYLESPNGREIKRSKIVAFHLVDLPFYPYNTRGEPKRFLILKKGEAKLPHGQRMIAVQDLQAVNIDAYNRSVYLITPPTLLEDPNEIRFYQAEPDHESVYMKRINELNPEIQFSLNKKEITNDVGSKAVFLPFFENDTMGIILLVES